MKPVWRNPASRIFSREREDETIYHFFLNDFHILLQFKKEYEWEEIPLEVHRGKEMIWV